LGVYFGEDLLLSFPNYRQFFIGVII